MPAESRAEKPKRRPRALVWSLIVLASVLLALSITANWVQRELLDTDQVVDTTDEIVDDEHVQEALSTYTVDQLYANVDVRPAEDVHRAVADVVPGNQQDVRTPAFHLVGRSFIPIE